MDCILGLDIGTTHAKILALSFEGKVVFESKAGYPTLQSMPGQSEQDPEVVLQAVVRLLRQATGSIGENIKGVCVSAAMHSILAVDESGSPLTNAFTWADTRSNQQSSRIRELHSAFEIYAATGTPIHPMSPLSKICWLRESSPDVFRSTAKFISLKEYVFFKLFGEYVIDHSMASATGLFDIINLQWHQPALEIAGINPGYLSQPVDVTTVKTGLKHEYCILTGLPVDMPFILGASDGCLANLGSGAVEKGEAALTIGTSGAIRMVTGNPVPDPSHRLFTYILAAGMYVTGGPISNGGSALRWFAENFLQHEMRSADDIEWMLMLAKQAPIGAAGLVFLPYLSGERAPSWDAMARGAFVGLQMAHGREHLARAVVEGISFSLLQVMRAVEENNGTIDLVYASGAFAGSDSWVQLMSDLLNKKIVVSAAADASALGAALLGMMAMGYLRDWKLLKQWIPDGRTFSPDHSSHVAYAHFYEIFEGLYPKLKHDFVMLAQQRH